MIEIKDLTLQIGTQELLKDVSVTIWDKKKIGIVGSNGCGKSTFFKLLQGEIEAAGDVTVSSYERICYVEQVIENTSLSVLEYVLQKDKQLMLLPPPRRAHILIYPYLFKKIGVDFYLPLFSLIQLFSVFSVWIKCHTSIS